MTGSNIHEAHGNLLDADVDALVNTVNTVGVMGKGIALQFKRAYPAMFKAYAKAAKSGAIELGTMHVFDTGSMTGPRFIINFPTKGHWRAKSRLADIDAGLDDLVRVIRDLDVRSVAVPPLGCGNGGLSWSRVRPLIKRKLADIPDVAILVYAPDGAPPAAAMRDATRPPKLTIGKAAMVALLASYAEMTFEVSQIEVQKLAYFLQVLGEPLRLEFAKAQYGPYADNLRKSLRSMEGHYILGFGDGSRPVTAADPITLRPGAREAADGVLATATDTRERIERVMELATGYESTYGLELLATVHWVATHDPIAEDPAAAFDRVADWNARKRSIFTREHVARAWEQLATRGWLLSHRPRSSAIA